MTIEINNIDKTAPDVNIVYSTEEPTNESVIVTLNTNEEVQDVAGWTKSANGKSLSKEYTVNKTDSVTIKDLAGNERTISFTIDNSIDNAINNTTNNTVNNIVNNSINNVIDNKTNTTTEETNTKVDNTTSSEILPYTGPKAKCIIVIGLISIIGIVLYVKFKKDYEGV